MAEAVGLLASAITLAALFKVCIEAFDVIRTYQTQELELKKLVLRLNVEKCRLYVWGQAMGLSRPSRRRRLHDLPFQDTVKESLGFIVQIFGDSRKVKDKYGCKEFTQPMQSNNDGSDAIRKFAAPFKNFRIQVAPQEKQPNVLKKTQWVVHDRKKFTLLIQEVKELIDGLQDITKGLSSVVQQDQVIYSHVMNIRDVDTLEMIASVCGDDHPQIAYAASTRAESISMASTNRNRIAAWRSGVESEESDNTSIASLENLTVTELKHQISRLLRDKEEREARRAPPLAALLSGEATLQQENGVLKETVQGLERERDFYFSKLRDIELYLQNSVEEDPELEKAEGGWARTIQNFLYATEDGFEMPVDEEPNDHSATSQFSDGAMPAADGEAENTNATTQYTERLQTATEASAAVPGR